MLTILFAEIEKASPNLQQTIRYLRSRVYNPNRQGENGNLGGIYKTKLENRICNAE